MNTFVNRLITTFHHVVSEQSGNDVTVARAKTMIALASLTWPGIGIAVTPHFITPRRMIWQSAAFDTVTMGGSFRRDPVGDDASIIIDEDEPLELVMLNEMRACSSFIPLFGRQRLERFNITLAELFPFRESGTPLPLPGSANFHSFHCEDEYRRLHAWLVDHGTISPDGEWQA